NPLDHKKLRGLGGPAGPRPRVYSMARLSRISPEHGPFVNAAPARRIGVRWAWWPDKRRPSDKIKSLAGSRKQAHWALNSAVECHLHTVEVIGSNPIAPTIMPLRFGGIRSFPACAGQDFASGLGRPLSGSSSNPIAPTTLRFRISEFSVEPPGWKFTSFCLRSGLFVVTSACLQFAARSGAAFRAKTKAPI